MIKLGGRLVVVSPNRVFDWFNAPKHWLTGYRSDPTIKYLFTARSMHRLLAIHGFERRRLKYVLSYPLIFLRAKMQLEVGASLRQLSYDRS